VPENSLRFEAYEALSGERPPEVYRITSWCEWRDLCDRLHRAWTDGKKLQVTVQEVPE